MYETPHRFIGTALSEAKRVQFARGGKKRRDVDIATMGMFNLQLFSLICNEERKTMIQFEVNDMTCGHCVGVITAAVKDVAPEAIISVDLAEHAVRVEGARDVGVVEQAIREAGYSPSRKA